jgi:hypothetical protein
MGAENWILRGKINGRLLLSEGEKKTLAEIAHRLDLRVWKAATANSDTILGLVRFMSDSLRQNEKKCGRANPDAGKHEVGRVRAFSLAG